MSELQPTLTFDGKDDYIQVPYTQQINPTVFTVSSWVKVTGGQGTWRSVITSRDDDPSRGYILYAGTHNKWEFRVGNGKATGGWDFVIGPAVVLNTWTHVAATFDGSKLKLYIDGTAAGEKAVPYAVNARRPLRIGAGATEGNPTMFLPGQIAEVCVWNKVRTQQEIQADMGKRLTGKEPGLVGYWPLNEGSGNTAADKTGGGKNGTINGATWQQQEIPIKPAEPTTGQFEVKSNSDTGVEFTNSQTKEVSYKFTPSGTWKPKGDIPDCTAAGLKGFPPEIQTPLSEGLKPYQQNLKYPNNTTFALLAVNKKTGTVTEVGQETTIVVKAGETLTFLVNDFAPNYGDNTGTLTVKWTAS